jgi:hypothetical protein
MTTVRCSEHPLAREIACLSDCDGGLSDYIKQQLNFELFRFPEIPRELDSRDSTMHIGWHVSY